MSVRDPSADADSSSPLQEPPASSPRPQALPDRRVTVAVAVLASLAAFGTWWNVPRPAMDLSGSGDIMLCAGRLTATEQDLVMGNVTFRPPREVQVDSVRLLDAVNVSLADAEVAATVAQPGGGGTTPGLSRGWPLTAADRAEYTLDWSTERPLAGAELRAGVEEAPILHLHVVDPTQDASFRAWQVGYRMDGRRWVSTFTHAFRMPGTVSVDNCAS
jgi:hypothetical protein